MILRTLGDPLITKLKAEKIELMINKLHDAESSPTTIRHYYNVLNIAFNWAIDRNHMVINPCSKIQKPKKSNKTMLVYDESQLKKLLDRVKKMTCYIPIMLAATTGMRLAEICGLRWVNIYLEKKYLEVKEQLQEVEGTLKLMPLKTASSKRKIILLNYTIEALKALRIKQEENKKYFGDTYNKLDYVICSNNGDPHNPDYVGRNYRRVLKEYKVCEDLGIPIIRFHDLRHTHATILLKANTHPKIVAERLGHSDIRMTLSTYSHVLPDMQEQAINDLNNKLKL